METELAGTILAQSPDAIIFAGTDGMVAYWNAAATRIFGHSEADAMGQSLDIIIPEQFREAHWKAYDIALANGATKYGGRALATRATRQDGTTIYVELSFSIVRRDGIGEALGAMACARDINERFESDRAMRRELRELRAAQKAPAGH
ncbi:hypothetical protein AYO38_01920 [bacterium SCGC AG-212-C10]|nr:hypothetical protein AYO38_01920 [bacterium SCGC AG-212-C10]